MVIQVMCDSNVHDAVARNDWNLKQLIRRCSASGLIAFKTTRVQLTELSQIPIENNIGQATAINAKRIGISMFFCGWSWLGDDRLGGPITHAAFEALRNGNPKHSADAMIGVTALTDADVLVTDDDDFRKQFKKLNTSVRVLSSSEFASDLGSLIAAN